jgi:putative phosphoesterase
MADPKTIVVVADCHIHPPKIDWPPAALKAMAGADLIVTLGDMGEAAGLAALQAIAPVVGVRGGDDETENPALRVVQAGAVRLGCVFDPVAHGLAASKSPFVAADEAAAAEAQAFGGPVDVLLCASTHSPEIHAAGGRLTVDPGSVTLPNPGGKPTFARLDLSGPIPSAEIVEF